jgi:hypothetical protein
LFVDGRSALISDASATAAYPADSPERAFELPIRPNPRGAARDGDRAAQWVNAALAKLRELDGRQAALVELRPLKA